MERIEFVIAQAESARLGLDGERFDEAVAIATAGLLIVFSALIFISLFISVLPRVLAVLARVWPEVVDWRHEDDADQPSASDEGDVLAAIGFVLHTEIQRQLAAESSPGKRA